MEVDDRFLELNTKTCVVLGGRGFLGRSLVLRLLKLGKWNVRIADSANSLELDPSEHDSLLSDALIAGRASYFHVDVRNKDQIVAALSGSSVVFYMDYEDSHSNDIYLSYMFIVQGAKNVINACRDCKVRRLIFNSSADVIFDGSRDILNGEESLTYPWKFEDMLSDLKAQAEALILFANDIDGLLTCALRPSNVFGPEDTRLVPFVVHQAKSGLAKLIIGNGENMSDFTFVENVTHAHICAEEALDFRMVSVAGKEGITLTIKSFSHLRKELSLASFTEFTDESKADKLLGGGRGTFISSAAQLLLSIIVVLYGYGFIPPNIYGFPVQKLSVTAFRQSDSVVRDSIMTLACLWNRGVHNARALARGEDWNYFLKAVAVLYLLKLLLERSLTMMLGMGLVFAFTAFFVYEQYEAEIDEFAKFFFIGIMELKRLLASHLPTPLMSFLCCDRVPHQATVSKR
uniref:Reticulon-like protein n=1 Tax=Cucumis melo TaxID=3656 RepID=A0A9I9CQ74_CUCME